MSGSAFNYFAFAEEDDLCQMYSFAKELNQPQKNYEDLVKFLKVVSAKDIVAQTSQFGIYGRTLISFWPPKIESLLSIIIQLYKF